MRVGYVVLYVTDPIASFQFWCEKIGMVEKGRKQAGSFEIVQVGFTDQAFAFELVPLELMKDNPFNLDLATPSIAFFVEDLVSMHQHLKAQGVEVSEINEFSGMRSFGMTDNEQRPFAVIQTE